MLTTTSDTNSMRAGDRRHALEAAADAERAVHPRAGRVRRPRRRRSAAPRRIALPAPAATPRPSP